MEIQEIKISELKFAEYNPRIITKEEFEGLKQSIKSFKLVDPIIVNKDLTIIGGHQRVRAAKELGFITVPCNVLDLDKKQEKKLNVVLNSHAISGKYDELKLDEILEELRLDEDYESLRLNELESLDLSTPEVHEDDFEPPKEAKYKVEPGDVFQLGEHRLVCGDSTDIEQVEKLMNGEKADMIFTDPPYGVSYAKKNKEIFGAKEYTEIKNDSRSVEDTAKNLWKPVFDNLALMAKDTCSIYCTMPQGGDQMMMMMMMMMDSWQVKHELIWVKEAPVFSMGRLNYDYKHEPIIYGWKKTHNWYGRGEFTKSVWEIKRDGDKSHPTMKPIQLIANALKNSTEEDNNVLDLFGGSGSTLIACEQLNRKCYMMELDPYYCSVIIERWEKLTNKEHQKL